MLLKLAAMKMSVKPTTSEPGRTNPRALVWWKIFGLLSVLMLSVLASAQPTVDHILVLKKQHKLLLLDGDQIVKTYSVALGRGGLAPKQREGDRKTPEGHYQIDFRNPASRYHLSLHISYPDETDRGQARERGVRPGGDIMIHGLGNDFKMLGKKHYLYDWTDGCIAVTDSEIEEIWSLVPDGTPVEIRP
jgi:murein L,D-transpeptidase YafK